MIILSYGGGTNTVALLCELAERGEPLDVILMADPGSEWPHTYYYRDYIMRPWLKARGMPDITVVKKVRRDQSIETLEQNCLRKNMLPSLAYGFKSCSQKYKTQPQEKWCNNNTDCRAAWDRGEKIIRLIGYDADEAHRWEGKNWDSDKYTYRAPLVEWDMGRDDCLATITRNGLPLPGKSSCTFCPATTKPEIRKLALTHPDLMTRALAMESQAQLTSVKGLGRRFSWAEFIKASEAQQELFCATIEQDCGCYDG